MEFKIEKIFMRVREMLRNGIPAQLFNSVVLFGGFAFLIQAVVFPKKGIVVGYLFYVVIASFSLMFLDKNRSKNKE